MPQLKDYDPKLDYLVEILNITIVSPLLRDLKSSIIQQFLFYSMLLFQILLQVYLFLATTLRILQIQKSTLQEINWEKRFNFFNFILHWYYTFYPIIFMVICCVSFSALSCEPDGLFSKSDRPELCVDKSIIYSAYATLVLITVQGILLKYIMRNHNFAENNALKRKFSLYQVINLSLEIIICWVHYNKIAEESQNLQCIFGLTLGFLSVYDQQYNYPYREPLRSVSIQINFLLIWFCLILMFKNSIINFSAEEHFYLIFLPGPLILIVGKTFVQSSQDFAMLIMDNTQTSQEKYVTYGIDELYQYFQYFQINDQSKIQFFRQIKIHTYNCSNKKCLSQNINFQSLQFNDRKQLEQLVNSQIICIFNATLTRTFYSKGQIIKPQFELLQLQYISYLKNITQRPLIAYMELRSYQNKNKQQALMSFFFNELINKISQNLELEIIIFQNIMLEKTKLIVEQQQNIIEQSLEKQLLTMVEFEQFLPMFADVISLKIAYWEKLIKGYICLDDFQQETLNLCNQIDQLYKTLRKKIGIPDFYFERSETEKQFKINRLSDEENNINIINLKLFSLLFSCIINDLDRAFYTENCIQNLVKNDRQKQQDIVDDFSLLQNTSIVLNVSMVKQKGRISNKNLLTIANFFGYDGSSDITKKRHITDFIPQDLQFIHDQLMNKFLKRGYSNFFVRKIDTYFLNRKGFLTKCYIKLGNLFQEEDDYILTASILKIMNQSSDVILFDQYGKIFGLSERIFDAIGKNCHDFTNEICLKFGYIFLIFPQVLTVLREQALKFTDQDLPIVNDMIDYLVVTKDLKNLSQEFQNYHGVNEYQQRKSSNNIFQSYIQSITISQQSEKKVKKQNNHTSYNENVFSDVQYLGSNIPMLSSDKSVTYLEWMQEYMDKLEKNTIDQHIKIKYSIHLKIINIKRQIFPYFELKNQIIYTNQSNIETTHLSLQNNIKRTLKQIMNEQSNPYLTQKKKTDGALKPDFGNPLKQQEQIEFKQMINTELIDIIQSSYQPPLYLTQQSQNLNQQICDNFNDLLDEKSDILQEPELLSNSFTKMKPQFKQILKLDEGLLVDEDNDFNQFNNQLSARPLCENQILLDIVKAKDNDDIDKYQMFESEVNEKKFIRSSKVKNVNKNNDMVQIIQENRRQQKQNDPNGQQQGQNGEQNSISSSIQTNSSKSPFLLIRNMYSIDFFQGNIFNIFIINAVILMIAFFIIIVNVKTTENQYNILQHNLNMLKYPEQINHFYTKITMLSLLLREQQQDLVTYSDFVNQQIFRELQDLKQNVSLINKIYDQIIQYEELIIQDPLLFQQVNELIVIQNPFDITLFIQAFLRNCYVLTNVKDQNFTQNTISQSFLFLRLNIISENTFVKNFLNILNNNIQFYLDSVMNSQSYMVIVEIIVISLLFIIQVRYWLLLNQYMEQSLLLITKITQQNAQDIIQSLHQAQMILEDPDQTRWKTINFNEIIFEKKSIKQQHLLQLQYDQSSDNLIKNKIHKTKKNQSYYNNHLSFRILKIQLSQKQNLLISLLIWTIFVTFLLGSIILTNQQLQNLKPALELNLDLIQFKIKFDNLVLKSEIIKTEGFIEKSYEGYQDINAINKIDFALKDVIIDNYYLFLQLIEDFKLSFSGIQFMINNIFQSLIKIDIASQQRLFLLPFTNDLCQVLSSEIPFCQLKQTNYTQPNDQNQYIPQEFIDIYGKPDSVDNNYGYINGGIIDMIHEFSKSIRTYFDTELNDSIDEISQYINDTKNNLNNVLEYLKSQAHVTQFVQHFLFQGKVFDTIQENLLNFNSSTLDNVIQIFEFYNYISGFLLFTIIVIIDYKWLKSTKQKLHLAKLGLILIPSENLLEQKTFDALKKLQQSAQ